MTWIAALPMYDWPELRAETDATWSNMRARFLAHGIDAPEKLVRRNGDMPSVSGGIRGADGAVIAPDPATLDPEGLDLSVLWRHPELLISTTCWGPMEFGLQDHVQVIGQTDYNGVAGGSQKLYSSAIIARKGEGGVDVDPSEIGEASLPIDYLSGRSLAFNEHRSMSGYLALKRDLQVKDVDFDIFGSLVETGSHRASVVAVARGQADVAAIDCRSWLLAQRFEPAASKLHAIGWTASRKGLPYIRAKCADLPLCM